MRRETKRGWRRRAERAALAVSFVLGATAAEAGLRFEHDVSDIDGGDVRCLAASGGAYWAGTASGVFRGTSLFLGSWALDGLSGKAISSLAAVGDEVWAATGESLWRRSADGTWREETLPAAAPFPTTVAVDVSGVLWAGGLGAWRRTGATWEAAPSPGAGIVVSMLADSQGLVVGLSNGSAARWNGSGWTAYAGGVGPNETARALASYGGTLWAGTNVTLYAWSGSAWVVDPAFGRHDVRALTASGGVLRVATADAGVFVRSGSGWTAERTGVLPRGGQAFLDTGTYLLLGTVGGGVYRRYGSGWTHVNGPDPAAVVTDIASFGEAAWRYLAAATSFGGGAEFVFVDNFGLEGDPPIGRLPDGCGEATAVARTSDVSFVDLLVATSCGPYLASASATAASAASAGLAAASVPTTLASHSGVVYGGTASTGLWRFSGGTWSAEPVAGYTGSGTVNAVRSFGGALWVAMAEGLFARGSGSWADVSAGLPAGGVVAALGGDASTAFVSLAAGGVYRRAASGRFLKDSAGLNTGPVTSIDLAGGRLFAAAGARGVALKRDGAWLTETAGLPAGARVSVVRGAGPTSLVVGTAGHGIYRANLLPKYRTLPVVVDVVGAGGSRFLSELVVGSRLSQDAPLRIAFSPSPGFAGPGGSLDAKADSPVAGSVTLVGDGGFDDLYLIARTYTRSATGGTFGLFYSGPSNLDAAEDEAAVYGLRSVSGEARSNLAVVHVLGRINDPITVSVQVYSAAGVATGDPLVRTLAPGEWYQWNGVLGLAGLPDGSYGYAKIRRTSGVGAFAAYGVVNDAKTSDGSYLPAFRPGGLAAARTLIVPVVLDVWGEAGSHYTTEVTLVNDGAIATPVDLVYRPAPGFGEVGGVPLVTVELAAREQVTIPDVLAYLRSHGMQIPDGTLAPQAGTLTATFRWLASLDAPSTVVLARTSTPNTDTATGGTFGLFYPGVAKGGGARTSALVPGLAQDESVRSNLAVVNVGGGSELPITLEAQLYDADTGAAAGSPLTARLAPGDWVQWSRIHTLAGAPASVKRFTVVVRRTSGDDTFFAYGVLNDAVTSDGSFQTMIPADPY
jgi:hypothetical protein